MAEEQRPPDPHATNERPAAPPREPIPWRWLGLGLLATLVGLIAVVALASAWLAPPPETAALPAPTIIRLTAPPSPTPSLTPPPATPTSAPTFTPIPTPDVAIAPETVTIGYYAVVVNTGEIGLIVRGGPSRRNLQVSLIPEGTLLLVLDGPVAGDDFQWWQVRLEDGTEGWVAGDFLAPAAAP
jgi:hypothetical protein